jgi:hypothetical protein
MKTKKLGGVAKTVIAQRQPADEVVRNMIEKDRPLTDAPEQIEPQVALGGRRADGSFWSAEMTWSMASHPVR